MKLSIVIAILNSHEIVRRQITHLKRMSLPDSVEILLMDDGSIPALEGEWVIPTNDFRPWTTGIARSTGARLAKGEYLLMTDIDHILSKELVDAVLKFSGDRMNFPRQFGVLDENGEFTQDMAVLRSYGLKGKSLTANRHGNSFAIRKDIFWDMGGYDKERSALPYPSGEDRLFNRTWHYRADKGFYKQASYGPPIYVFPSGRFCGDDDYNPFGLFHNLSRKHGSEHSSALQK